MLKGISPIPYTIINSFFQTRICWKLDGYIIRPLRVFISFWRALLTFKMLVLRVPWNCSHTCYYITFYLFFFLNTINNFVFIFVDTTTAYFSNETSKNKTTRLPITLASILTPCIVVVMIVIIWIIKGNTCKAKPPNIEGNTNDGDINIE